ncbi:signal peptidase II [Desulfobulbus alkaliphilus]|uniref:signal peptidase II n=1 Tax=Desulfobulbus alkaliphilus TaxID=869814 RepID=UPI00196566E9|nr:signal peptidase II [Desulfobulbus alkaliphilus]
MTWFFSIIILTVFVDQVSKYWVFHNFILFESRTILPGFFNLTYLTNNGAAFSILAGQPALWRQVFFIGTALVALVLIWLFQRSYGRNSTLYTVALALVAGGAVGNMIDRIRFGFVIDFLDFHIGSYHWPTFNVADSAIFIGVSLFIFKNLVLDR